MGSAKQGIGNGPVYGDSGGSQVVKMGGNSAAKLPDPGGSHPKEEPADPHRND